MPVFEPPWIRDSCFVTPFKKGVEYSQVSLSHNDKNCVLLHTRLTCVEVKDLKNIYYYNKCYVLL